MPFRIPGVPGLLDTDFDAPLQPYPVTSTPNLGLLASDTQPARSSSAPLPDTNRRAPPAMAISPAGIGYIQQIERPRLKTYKDAGGKDTIGYGHLLLPGESEKFRDGIDMHTALQLFATDLRNTESAVRRLVKVPLLQHEYDALVLFTYNIGQNAFANSKVLRELNAGNREAAVDEMSSWHFVNGASNNGLIDRRRKEQNLFRNGG